MAQTIEDVESRTLLQQFHSLYKKQDAIETNVENVDAKVDQEKDDRQTADAGLQKLIYQQATFLGNEVSGLRNDINTNTNKIEYNTTQITALKSDKQDKLTAGTNITIENNTISASAPENMVTTDTMQTITNGKIFDIDGQLNTGFVTIAKNLNGDTTLNLKESVSGGNVEMSYGKLDFIKGSTTYTQTLPEKSGTFAMMSDVNTKQDKLTAGTNITIDANNVISASGGEQVYEHHISITDAYRGLLTFTIKNNDSTNYGQRELAKIITALENQRFNSSTSRLMASGVLGDYPSTEIQFITGVYSENSDFMIVYRSISPIDIDVANNKITFDILRISTKNLSMPNTVIDNVIAI